MKEFISINGSKYEVAVSMGLNTMLLTLPPDITSENAAEMFKNITSINLMDENDQVYGEYPYVEYRSVTVSADDTVTISMNILNKTDQNIRDLQQRSEQQRADIDFIASMNNIEL